jgi:ATP-binding protein involved in chromosome partitioning
MTVIQRQDIEKLLAQYEDPYIKQDLLSAKVIQHIEITAAKVLVKLLFGFPLGQYKNTLMAALESLLKPHLSHIQLQIDIEWQAATHAGKRGIKALSNVKNIIAIASGKGGVGKSTTAVNIALALAQDGARVGMLDADIYGPSQPTMLGAPEAPELKGKKTLLPVVRHGIQSMSIGYLIEQTTAMIWRGPMVSTALQQLLNDTLWDALDYLIIDLPPGTGDIQLTLSQKIPVTGAVIVTTPQDLALLDARRAIDMFNKVNIPVLGIVENMSGHVCSQCGHAEAIFGSDGAQRMADASSLDVLGKLPLDKTIREQTDSGIPTVIANKEGKIAHIYHDIARKLAAKISLQAKDYSHVFPQIVIQKD